MKSFFTGLLILMTGLMARAGQESHGGNALLCTGQQPVILDYYYASLPHLGGNISIVDISEMSADQVINFFKQRLSGSYFGGEFNKAVDIVGNYSRWALASDLYDQNDSGSEFPVPTGCELKQIAVRDGTKVYVDRLMVSQLSPAQLGILAVHETLFYLAEKHGQTTAASTRNVVSAILEEPLNTVALANSIYDLGWAFTYIETLPKTEDLGIGNYFLVAPVLGPATWYFNKITIVGHSPMSNELDMKVAINYASGDSSQSNSDGRAIFNCNLVNECTMASMISGVIVEGTKVIFQDMRNIKVKAPHRPDTFFRSNSF